MIDTLMALWNRGNSGRGIMVSTAFVLICISISLLLVTVGGSWSSLFAQKPTYPSSIVGTADLTATAQSSGIQPVADNTATFQAPTSTAQLCVTLTPHSGKTPTAHVSVTAYKGVDHPSKPTVTPTHLLPTPSPIRPTPTTVIPTATPTVVPTDTPTPIITPIPTNTPTPVVTPTNTPTPVVTPNDTPTPVVTPTITPTISVTPTITVVSTPTSSPIVIITQTHRNPTHGGTPVGTGTGTTGQNGNGSRTSNTGCNHSGTVGDNLDIHSSDGSITAMLERDVWFILGGSTGGTLLFYTSVYFIMRKKVRKS